MRGLARTNDRASGGAHCHGHDHGLMPAPGRITTGSARVFVDGRPAARAGDSGSSVCCAGIGTIKVLPKAGKVFIDGRPAAGENDSTLHCGMANGSICSASRKTFIG